MPLDAVTVSPPTTLAEHLRAIGITPVPMDVLDAHKKAQIRLNPPSLFARPMFFVMICVVSAIAAGLLKHPHNVMDGAIDVMIGIVVDMFCYMSIGLYSTFAHKPFAGRARWTEYQIGHFGGINSGLIPRQIIRIAIQATWSLPAGSQLLYGELIQDKDVLDPYLVVVWNNERVCLGIWDGTTIIACPTID